MRLLHLAPASRERAIERGGLRGGRATLPAEPGGTTADPPGPALFGKGRRALTP